MRVSKIPKRRPKVTPLTAPQPLHDALTTAAQLVTLYGDTFVDVFEVVEAEANAHNRRVDARRRAFKLIVDNTGTGLRQASPVHQRDVAS